MSGRTSGTQCGPCSRDGAATASPTRFCVNCNESLCETCVRQHQKFTSTRNHTFVQAPADSPATFRTLSRDSFTSTVYCPKHSGKLLDSYCNLHKVVCCSICAAVEHATCQRPDDRGIVSIAAAAHDITKSGEFAQARKEVTSVLKEVEILKTKRQNNLLKLSQKKAEIAAKVADYRAKVTEKLLALEKVTNEKLDNVYFDTAVKVEADIQLCEDVALSLQALPALLDTEAPFSDSELFIYMKKAEKQLEEGKKIIESVGGNLDKEVLELKIDQSIEHLVDKIEILGKFVLAQRSYSAVYLGDYKISSKYEGGQRLDVQDCTVLPDGRIIILHGTERKLKVLDTSYSVTDQLDLSAKPFGVCVAGEKELIISMKDSKYLQYVNVTGKPKLGRSMKLGVDCYGLVYRSGEIFVACGGGAYDTKPQLRVYNNGGALIRIVEKGNDDKQIFTSPRNLALSPDGNTVFISDTERGIVTFDVKHSIVSGFWHRELKSPRGITLDSSGNIIVCGYNSHNVMQFTSDGKVVCTILNKSDGIMSPLSVCLVSQRLIVTFDKSRVIKVYALKSK